MPYLMKGKNWKDRESFRKKIEYPVWVEPKVDDIRVRVSVSGDEVLFLSYAEKPLHNLGFAACVFSDIAEQFDIQEFDCAFRCNNSFNDSYRWVRSSSGAPQDLHDAPKVFYILDLPGSPDHTYYERRRLWVEELVRWANIRHYRASVQQLPAVRAASEAEVDSLYNSYRKQGHEGAMVKTNEHAYQRGKRSQDWLKMKPEDTSDGLIVEIHEAVSETGVQLGRAGSITVRLEDGSYATPHGIPHELGAELWNNQHEYLVERDQWVEFAFMERDRQGGYRHPVFRRLRESK